MLYIRHPSSLEHDPGALSPGDPDGPERIAVVEDAMAVAGWCGCQAREAPAAIERELRLLHADEHVRAESIAPDPLTTPRIASHVGHFWTLA